MALSRKQVADTIDAYDAEIAALQESKRETFQAYREELSAVMGKDAVKDEIEGIKAAIKRRQAVVKKGETAVDHRDALVEEIFAEITAPRAPRATRVEIIEEFDRDDRRRQRFSESMDDAKALSEEAAKLGLIDLDAHAETARLADALAEKFGNGALLSHDAETGEIIEPLLPPAAQEVVAEDLGSRAYSSGRTESSEDGQPIRAGSHIAADHGDAGPDGADKMGSAEAGSVASEPETNSPETANEKVGGSPAVAAPFNAEEAGRTPAYAIRGRSGTSPGAGVTAGETALCRGGEAVTRQAHNLEIAGAIPAPATNSPEGVRPGKSAEPQGSAAPVRVKTKDETADQWGLPAEPHPDCQKPGLCGRFSHVGLCAACRGESAVAA